MIDLSQMSFDQQASTKGEEALKVAESDGFPRDYLDFMATHQLGGEGWLGDGDYLILWAIEDLGRLNKDYEVDVYAPGLVVFGSSGGGEAYAFDTRRSPWPVVEAPFVGLSLDLIVPISPTFTGFLMELQNCWTGRP